MVEQRELVPDAWRAPERILNRHAPDEGDDRGVEFRPSRLPARLPAPVVAEAVSMPADHRVGFHDDEVFLPVLQELASHRPEHPIAVVELRTLHAAFEDSELLAECDVLQREPRAFGSERADESQQMQDEVHAGASRAALGGATYSCAVESKTR